MVDKPEVTVSMIFPYIVKFNVNEKLKRLRNYISTEILCKIILLKDEWKMFLLL